MWQHLQKRNRDGCLGATRNVQQSQGHLGLQRFILLQQPIAKDDESSTNRREKVIELLNECAPEEFLAAKARCLVLLQQLNGNTEEDEESSANLWEKVIQLLGRCTPEQILARLQRLLELQQLIGKHEESSSNRWEKVIKLLGQMSPEEMLEAKGSITKASLCLKPSELVLQGFRPGLAPPSLTILEAISKPQQVTNLTLNLGSNDIGPEGARSLAEAVSKLQQITNVKLHFDDVIGSDVKAEIERRLQKPGRRVEVNLLDDFSLDDFSLESGSSSRSLAEP